MADKTIPQLQEKENILSTDLIPVDDGTATYKATIAKLIQAIPGVTGVTINPTGDGIIVAFRSGEPVEIIPHDDSKQDVLTFDAAPTDDSTNPVTSGGVYTAVNAVAGAVSNEASRAAGVEQALLNAILAIAANLATYQATDVSTKPYEVGDLMVRNNLVLYKVTMTIPDNSSIQVGTNVEVTTIEEVLHNTKPVEEGGTGATTAADARTNLGLGTAAECDSTSSVTEDSDDLPTGGAVYTAVKAVQDALNNLGLYIDQAGYLCQSIAE